MTNKRTRGGSRKEPPTAQRKRAREATLFEHVSHVDGLGVLPPNTDCRNAGRWSAALSLGKQRLRSTGFRRGDHGARPPGTFHLRKEGTFCGASSLGPLTVSLLAMQAMDVAPGGMHTVVLLEDGTLWSAGVNDDGALGRETAVDDDGEPVPGKDATRFGQVDLPRGAAPVVQLACSDSASFALTLDGSVYGWGTFRNEHGVFGFSERVKRQETPARVYVPGGRKAPVTKIAAGANHVVGILEVRFDGRLRSRGVRGSSSAQDGGAISWGDGDQGQLGRVSLRHSRRPNVIRRTMLAPTKIAGCRSMQFSDVFCGEYSTFLRAANGHFFAFGLNNCCQLAIPHPRALSNEDTQTPESRASNLVTLLKPTWVEAFQTLNILKVAPGKDHGIAVNEAGCVYSWGVPTYGVLGRANVADLADDTRPFPIPEKVSGLEEKTIVDVASGQVSFHFLCLNAYICVLR